MELKVSTIFANIKGLQVQVIDQTKGESGAAAVQFALQDFKSGRSKFRLCLFSRGLQAMLDDSGMSASEFIKTNGKDLRITSYIKNDEEVGASYRVWQLRHKDEESKFGGESAFGDDIVSEDEIVDGFSFNGIMSTKDMLIAFVDAFELYDPNAANNTSDVDATINAAQPAGAEVE